MSGLRAGLTMNDISEMDIGEIVDVVITLGNVMDDINDNSNSKTSSKSIKKATQQDIDRIFG